jgi:hypothetical protein
MLVGADDELGNEFVRKGIKVFRVVFGAHGAASEVLFYILVSTNTNDTWWIRSYHIA